LYSLLTEKNPWRVVWTSKSPSSGEAEQQKGSLFWLNSLNSNSNLDYELEFVAKTQNARKSVTLEIEA
jgi:hypothetical protein